MKTTLLASLAAFAGYAVAFNGQLSAGPHDIGEGNQPFQMVYLTDYGTGSQYETELHGTFDACTGGKECGVYFQETTPGGYFFSAKLWRTNDGCHNIDFEGGLGAGHGFCCGSLPCNINA